MINALMETQSGGLAEFGGVREDTWDESWTVLKKSNQKDGEENSNQKERNAQKQKAWK